MNNVNLYTAAHGEKVNHEGLAENFARLTSVTAGMCIVCGQTTFFRFIGRNLRETGKCIRCLSNNRQRQVASILIRAVEEISGLKCNDCHDLVKKVIRSNMLSGLNVYNTETTGALHNQLSRLDNYQSSEYFGHEYQSGDFVSGTLHQDLMSTSFDEESQDIVLSSDVFEHVPEPYMGFSEIFRILRPGGRHIFTVPFYADRDHDEVRAVIDSDGRINHLMSPMYHGDPIRPEGIIVFVIFSREMVRKLEDIGYRVVVHYARDPVRGILGDNAIVFEAIKPI